MKSHLYFSMQRSNETQDAWLSRTAPAYEHRNHNAGLSGRPEKQGIRVFDFEHTLASGGKVKAVRVGYGLRASRSVERFAKANGLGFERYNGNGCSGMCERLDGVAYETSKRSEVYDNEKGEAE
jgi:hypothetical protein